jgi:hypothetical protein
MLAFDGSRMGKYRRKRAKRDAVSELMTSIAEIVKGILGLLAHG